MGRGCAILWSVSSALRRASGLRFPALILLVVVPWVGDGWAFSLPSGGLVATAGSEVVLFDPITGARSTLVSGGLLTQAGDVAVGVDHHLFVVDGPFGDQRLVRIDRSGNQSLVTTFASDVFVWSLAAGPRGQLYAAVTGRGVGVDEQGGALGGVMLVDMDGVQTIVLAAPRLGDIVDLAVAPNGDIVAVTTFGWEVEIDPVTGASSSVEGPHLRKISILATSGDRALLTNSTVEVGPSRLQTGGGEGVGGQDIAFGAPDAIYLLLNYGGEQILDLPVFMALHNDPSLVDHQVLERFDPVSQTMTVLAVNPGFSRITVIPAAAPSSTVLVATAMIAMLGVMSLRRWRPPLPPRRGRTGWRSRHA
jgi:hypothetical protein